MLIKFIKKQSVKVLTVIAVTDINKAVEKTIKETLLKRSTFLEKLCNDLSF